MISKRNRVLFRGGSKISGKGVHMYKGAGVLFADFISFFLNILNYVFLFYISPKVHIVY